MTKKQPGNCRDRKVAANSLRATGEGLDVATGYGGKSPTHQVLTPEVLQRHRVLGKTAILTTRSP